MKEIIDLTKRLIPFRSLHAEPGQIRRCADFVQTYLTDHGIDFQRFDHNGIPSILAPPCSGRIPLLLLSHIDVVDGPDHLFEPCEKNGRLYGRGSIDDKYAVALSLVLLKNTLAGLQAENRSPDALPLGVLITGDEEIGGKNGTQKVLRDIAADFCIVLDGGSPDEIVVRQKGILKLKLIARGKTAHAARPWLGENAIEKLIADYLKLKTFFEPPPGGDADHWHRTLNFSILHAGAAHNQVPDTAEARFDIRYTEADRIDDLVAQIAEAMQSEVVVEAVEPLFDSPRSPELEMLLEIAGSARLGYEHGASDARHVQALGVRAAVWGADGELSQHSDDEHVRIDSVAALYGHLQQLVQRLAVQPWRRP